MSIRARTHEQMRQDRERKAIQDRQRRGPALLHRFNGARAAACDQVGLRYRPVPAPRSEEHLRVVLTSVPTKDEKTFREFAVPDSFEILTEPLGR